MKTVLVTGGSGFVGGHCIVQLLRKGYRVKTTVRNLAKSHLILQMLEKSGIETPDIEFVQADLMSDEGWSEAMNGCEFVLHVASPIFLRVPEHEDEMIRPAVDGTLRVLRAARNAGVKRVVMTSNYGAVGYSHKNRNVAVTEVEWTDPNEKGLSAYNKSKVLAEKAAWKFVSDEGGGLELSVINPVGIFGPALNKELSSGFELIRNVITGKIRRMPDLYMNVIDVRDVADLHIRAMESPDAAGERFLALAGGKISLPEIANLARQRFPEVSGNSTSKLLPGWVISIAALFNERARDIASMLRATRNVSNEKAKRILNWEPIASNEEAIMASIKSMIEFKHL